MIRIDPLMRLDDGWWPEALPPINFEDPQWCKKIHMMISWLQVSKIETKEAFSQISLPHFSSADSDKCRSRGGICSGQNLTPARITICVLKQGYKPTLWNPIRSLSHSPSEDFPLYDSEAISPPEDYDSNPRVTPCGSNFFHPTTDRDESRRSRKWLSALISLLS